LSSFFFKPVNGYFWSNDPETPIGRMVQEMGLENEDELVDRNLKLQDSLRGGPPNPSSRTVRTGG